MYNLQKIYQFHLFIDKKDIGSKLDKKWIDLFMILIVKKCIFNNQWGRIY